MVPGKSPTSSFRTPLLEDSHTPAISLLVDGETEVQKGGTRARSQLGP